jgi:hypothetical protein
MPGGVHIRLVAPLDYRIRNFAKTSGLSEHQARARVHELDEARRGFFRHHFPRRVLAPESFAATFNTAVIEENRLVRTVAAMLGK